MNRRLQIDWLRLTRTVGMGPVGIRRLLERFGAPDAVLAAGPPPVRSGRLVQVGAETDQAPRSGAKPSEEEMGQELDRLLAMGGRMVILGTGEYPPQLAAIHDPPPLLFALGEVSWLLGDNLIAIVGSRSASRSGLRIAADLARDLAAAGLILVSGLARGIDTAVHAGALDAGGATVAVVATGLDVDYPPGSQAMKARIRARGCLVSEALLGTPPLARFFPPRNRIISGLCRGVVVVEAAARSGSLITARQALEQGREVFAVPGAVGDPHYEGTNALIREGATLIRDYRDILEGLSWTSAFPFAPPAPPSAASVPRESVMVPTIGVHHSGRDPAAILDLLRHGPLQGDELARICRLTVTELSRILLLLELNGVVERLPGNLFALRGDSSLTSVDDRPHSLR